VTSEPSVQRHARRGRRDRELDIRRWYDLGYTCAMKTAISIPDTMFQAAERMARRLGISRSQLFQQAVQRYMEEQRKLGVTEALDEIYGDARAANQIDPVLSRLLLASLPREDW